MQRNLLAALKRRIYKCIYLPIRKVGSLIIPAGAAKPYSFNCAKEYWQNVPRAQGGNPLNTRELKYMLDEDLVRAFDKEIKIARKKEERKVGFSLAVDSIAALDVPEVMDYGSGIGFYGFEIMARHHGARVTFVDIHDTNLTTIIRIARSKELIDRMSCEVVRDEQARDLVFDKQFDLIVSMGVLHHTPYALQIVRNLTRFLKEKGIFQVMLYNYTYLRHMESVAGKRLNVSNFGAMTDPVVGDLSNPFSEAYDDGKAQRLFQGYELVTAVYPNPYYNIYQFRKPRKVARHYV